MEEKIYTKEDIEIYKHQIKMFIIRKAKKLDNKKEIIEMLYEYL